MNEALNEEIRAILEAGKDLTLATVREDGWPQATTVSYASDGLRVFFGCGSQSQKARNLARDDRVSLTVNLPYGPWSEIRGLSIGGRGGRGSAPAQHGPARAPGRAPNAPPSTHNQQPAEAGDLAMFEIRPEVVSVLDYRKGFGHTDLVRPLEAA